MQPARYQNLLIQNHSLLVTPREDKNQFIDSDRSRSPQKNSRREEKGTRKISNRIQRRKSTVKVVQKVKKITKMNRFLEQDSYEEGIDEDVQYQSDLISCDNKLYIRKNQGPSKSKLLVYYKSIKQIMEQNISDSDREIRMNASQIKNQKMDIVIGSIMEEFEIQYARDVYNDNYNLHLQLVEGWDEIYQTHLYYHDRHLFLCFRKWIIFISNTFSLICYKITISKYFNFTMLFLVSLNMILYITRYYGTMYKEYSNLFDLSAFIFFWIYLVEHSIKIFGLGLVPFLSEFWNIYDLINLITFGLYIYDKLSFDFSPLRAMRILIFLGKLSLQLGIVLKAISEALKFMIEASLVVIIFCLFFANAGVHMFRGILLNQCFDLELGIISFNGQICGWTNCSSNQTCAKSLTNPDIVTNFDNFFYAFAQIIRTITMDNWTDVMYQTMYAINPMTWLYFVFVIFIVGFFAFNLIIAVLKTYYSSIVQAFQQKDNDPIIQKEVQNANISLNFIKDYGLYNSIKTLQRIKKQTINTNNLNKSQNQLSMSVKIYTPHNETQYLNPTNEESVPKPKGIGLGQLNTFSKMIKRAKTIKDNQKQLRQVLSARQQRYLQSKKIHYIEVKQKWYQRYTSLKKIFLPVSNLNIELKKLEIKVEQQMKEKKLSTSDQEILNKYIVLLKQHDVLQWKLEVTYKDYDSSSKGDVINQKKQIQKLKQRLIQKYQNIKNHNLRQYHILHHKVKEEQLSSRYQPEMNKSLSIDSQAGSLKKKLKYPHHRSSRIVEYFHEDRKSQIQFFQQNKSLSSKKTLKNEQSKKILTIRKAPSLPQSQSEVVEFPEWQEGQTYLLMNGMRWNYQAMKILINRVNEDYYDDDDSDDSNYDFEFYLQFRQTEVDQKYIKKHNSSIQNVRPLKQKKKLIKILKQLNSTDTKIWINGFIGVLLVSQQYLKQLLNQQLVSITFDILTMFNFIVLCADGYLDENLVQNINSIMTFCLSGEIGLKVIGQGVALFSQQSNNILDSTIVIICLVQYFIAIIKPNWLKDFSSEISALRAFKALMFYRIIKYNQFVVRIMRIAQKTFQSYLNITFLMFFVIFMYAIIGQQFFVGRFDETLRLPQLHSFDSIGKAWMTVFNVITNDDAYGLLRAATTYQDVWVGLVFYFAMVFALNYLIYGLVSAVLLDAFSSELEKGNENELEKYKQLELVGIMDKIDIDNNDDTLESEYTFVGNTEENLTLQSKATRNSLKTLIKQVEIYKQMKTIPETVRHLFTNQKTKLQYFKNIDCTESLFLFSYQSKFRRLCYRVCKSYVYKFIFNLSICSSVASLIVNSFLDNVHYLHLFEFVNMYDYHLMGVNIVIGIAYGVEIISQGMWMDEGAFCRDIWRFFDIVYLLSYYFCFVADAPILKIVLYIIYLRPLMMINMFQSIQGIKNAMTKSLTQILNVIGVILLVFLIFDIFGMHLFKNKMGYCEDQMNFDVNYEECMGNKQRWIIYPYNFDNIANGLLTLFVIASLDGWGETMQICFNSNNSKYGPSSYRNQWATYIFYILFIFIGAMFFMGFLTGVLFTEFQKYTKQLESKHLTQDQSQFLKISQLILKKGPNYSNAPKSLLRRISYKLVFNKAYRYYFITVLTANTIVLCLFYEGANQNYMGQLNTAYQVLTAMFALDTICKLLAYGQSRYFANTWRVIEFALSILAVGDFWLDLQIGWFNEYLTITQNQTLFTVYRMIFLVRDIRVLLIIQEFKGLSRLLRVLEFSISLLFKILYIQVIAQITFALIAQQLFGHISAGNVIDNNYANFHNFLNSALLMFKCTTGDDWRALMVDCTIQNPYCYQDPQQCGSNWAYPFFLTYYLFSNIMIMNLFVLALVEQFESIYPQYLDFFNSSSNAIQTYVENIDHFCNVWCKYTFESKGLRMHTRFIARFLLDLGEPLGALNGDNIWDTAKSASNFRIRADKQGYVDFNELLYETIHFYFKQKVFKEGSVIGKKQMKQFDKAMKKKIKENSVFERMVTEENVDLLDKELFKASRKYSYQNFNILQEYLNVLIALKTWEKYSQNLKERSRVGLSQFTEGTSQSDEDKLAPPQKFVTLMSKNQLNASLEDLPEPLLTAEKKDMIYRINKNMSNPLLQGFIMEPQSQLQKQQSSLQDPSRLDSSRMDSCPQLQRQKSILKNKNVKMHKLMKQQ